ncbi:Prothoracicostatic peptide [Halotydeus destructor]|nr:Prothoracicostatic peptide [Halotydeus destructor]
MAPPFGLQALMMTAICWTLVAALEPFAGTGKDAMMVRTMDLVPQGEDSGGPSVSLEANSEESKRSAQWNKLQGAWGKRAAQWNKLQGAWGKRGQQPEWNRLNAVWGKRPERGWNNLSNMWGKRAAQWNNLNGMWGKREWSEGGADRARDSAQWNNLRGMWGKRSVNMADYFAPQ